MSQLRSQREAQLTRKKLVLLEEMYAKAKSAPVENAETRQLTLLSLRRTINQLTEEIERFEARTNSA
jgi:hypothetical protein